LKAKEEEINILWNVIKEINKQKGEKQVSVGELKQFINTKSDQSQKTSLLPSQQIPSLQSLNPSSLNSTQTPQHLQLQKHL
jgi:hypothetical protein